MEVDELKRLRISNNNYRHLVKNLRLNVKGLECELDFANNTIKKLRGGL